MVRQGHQILNQNWDLFGVLWLNPDITAHLGKIWDQAIHEKSEGVASRGWEIGVAFPRCTLLMRDKCWQEWCFLQAKPLILQSEFDALFGCCNWRDSMTMSITHKHSIINVFVCICLQYVLLPLDAAKSFTWLSVCLWSRHWNFSVNLFWLNCLSLQPLLASIISPPSHFNQLQPVRVPPLFPYDQPLCPSTNHFIQHLRPTATSPFSFQL